MISLQFYLTVPGRLASKLFPPRFAPKMFPPRLFPPWSFCPLGRFAPPWLFPPSRFPPKNDVKLKCTNELNFHKPLTGQRWYVVQSVLSRQLRDIFILTDQPPPGLKNSYSGKCDFDLSYSATLNFGVIRILEQDRKVRRPAPF